VALLDDLNQRMSEGLSAEDASVVARWLEAVAVKFSRED